MTQRKKPVIIVSLGVLMTVLAVGTVLAVVPPSTYGYITLCHDAGTPGQNTLILKPEDAAAHLAHGDPQVRCADPIPGFAFDPSVDLTNGYHVAEIEDNLYWVTDGTYQMMFLVYRKGVVVVDAPPSIGENILNAIAEVTDLPITHVIYSHSHADHIGAAGIYPETARVIAHEETAAQLEAALSDDRPYPYGVFVGGGPVPLPDRTFKNKLHLRVIDQVLELEYKGPVHEPGNIFIYAPEQKVLMLVDVIFPAWSPFADFALAEDIPAFYEAHEQVLDYDFDTFIGGHLTRLGSRSDVELAQQYILDIRDNAAAALSEVDFFTIAQETGFENQWLLFSTYLDTVAQTCAEMTVQEWSGQLAAADIFTYDHCWTAMESLRIE
jgi:glyoxylase-like metal-dependent hydrolase (beta-lactamase superfamily II)